MASSQKRSQQDEKEKDNHSKKTWVIIDGFPQLQQNEDYSKYAQALEETAQHFSNKGSKKKAIVYIPHTTNKTKYSEELQIDGCGLIQFGTVADAQQFAANYRVNTKLRQLNLLCYTWEDIMNYDRIPDEYSKLKRDDFQKGRNLLWWLLDENGGESFRDQYVIRCCGQQQEETIVYWNDKNEVKDQRVMCYDASELKAEKKVMTNLYVKWSPNGLFLVTTHPKGIGIWGGPKWKRLQRLIHDRVDKISFSPRETFIITLNSSSFENNKPVAKIWDVLTGSLIQEVSYKTIGPSIKLRLPGWWPIFQWSSDEKYIVKVNSSKGMSAKAKDINKINIFEIISVSDNVDKLTDRRYKIEKLGGKSLTVDSLFDIKFSPCDNILAYTSVAINNEVGGKVVLVGIPKKDSLKIQALGCHVKKAHLHWQSEGKYLAVIMGHSPKTFIKNFTIGIMTVYMKNYPFSRTDSLGFIIDFKWEPEGNRFAVIHNNKSKRDNPDVSIYRIGADQPARLIHTFQNRKCNSLYWSPAGERLVIADIDKSRRGGGELEFIDIKKITQYYGSGNNKLNGPTVKQNHDGITDIEWDPSGRCLITATTQILNQTSGDDTGYTLWSYQGDKLVHYAIKYFYQILWRPTPRKITNLLLNKSDRQSAKNKLNNGWDIKFKKWDDEVRGGVKSDTKKKNLKIQENYCKYVKSLKNSESEIKNKRNEILKQSGYTTNTVHEWKTKKTSITKAEDIWKINKETMKKILAGENVDF